MTQQTRSCLIYAFSASAKDLRPALIAGLIRGVSGFGLFMRQLLANFEDGNRVWMSAPSENVPTSSEPPGRTIGPNSE